MAYFANLVGRLSLDSTAFDRNAKRSGKSMYAMQRQSLALKQGILNLAGAYLTTRGLVAAVRGSVMAYMAQEKAEKDLQAALVNTGGMVGSNIDSLKTYAAAMQQVTIYGDEQILNQMAYATNLGVTRDRLKEATKAAIGLAAKYRLDLQTAFMLIGRASKGQTQMLTRYGIILGDTLTEQEKFNEILRLGAEAFGLATAQTEHLQGATEQLKAAWSDTKEAIGDLIDEPLADYFKEVLTPALKEMSEGFANVKTVIDEVSKSVQEKTKHIRELNSVQHQYNLMVAGIPPEPRPPEHPAGPVGSYQGTDLKGHAKETEWLNARLQKLYGSVTDSNQKIAADTRQRNDEMVKDTRQATVDMAAAYRRMYNDLNEKTQQSWDLRYKLLSAEYAEILKLTQTEKDRAIAADWMIERMKTLGLQYQQVLGGPIEAMAARIHQITRDLPTLGQAFADIAERGINGIVNGLTDAVFEARNFGQAVKEIARDMAKMAFRWGMEQAVYGGLGAVFHGGGTVGGGMQVVKHSPPAAFMGAPRFHGGGEVPAWLQPGERVHSKQQVGATDRVMGRMVALLERIAAKDTSPTVAIVQSEEQILNVMRSRAGEEAIERARGRTEIQ